MKQEYERTALVITAFDAEDVITTSDPDRNNGYTGLSNLDEIGNESPAPPGTWF